MDFTKARRGGKAWWIWSGIWEARKWVEKGIVKVIGNGRDTTMFQDLGCLFDQVPFDSNQWGTPLLLPTGSIMCPVNGG
ncbi:unnamed protein product [Linum trigynum]|uniref:Uncharacterized protein n=1 Tax=Linum trigynum TaxID=586398 RepID=A0AAV2GS28_9ROSI